mmetsp:Transcript_12090/g.17187  ORF Transcript_12090/g.17187 Transcript_12090/m.17187 type:complete len:432 (+) Transcript_12090:233-1528(+)
MVSSLSSRLLATQAKVLSSAASTSSKANSSSDYNDGRTEKSTGLSGYSADMETSRPSIDILRQPPSSPPGHINLNYGSRRPTSPENQAKRQKLQEKEYEASNVRADLKKAGMAYPSITVGRSRVIPLGKVDMSKVELVHSKNVESSPFLTEALPKSYTTYFASNIGFASCKFASQTMEAYRSRSDRQDNASEVASTASNSSLTLSDNESDDNSSPEVSINPRLDDAVMTNLDEKSDYSSIKDPHQASCGPSFSIEEALTPLSEPRLVTLSSKPYTVVHVNAAFTRMTGMKSDCVIGNSLWKILAPSPSDTTPTTNGISNDKLSLETCAAGDEVNITILQPGHQQQHNNNNNNQNEDVSSSSLLQVQQFPQQQPVLPEKGALNCNMRVMPIVSSNSLTHYAVDVLYTPELEHEDLVSTTNVHHDQLQAQVVG